MIRTRGLAYRYGAGPQLQFADVDLPQGGTLLLQGRSGTGKSTWLALVAGLRAARAVICSWRGFNWARSVGLSWTPGVRAALAFCRKSCI